MLEAAQEALALLVADLEDDLEAAALVIEVALWNGDRVTFPDLAAANA